MIRLAVFLIGLFSAGLAQAQPFPALYRAHDIAADDVLNIHVYSDPEAFIIDSLPHDATGVEITGLDISGNWGQINTDEEVGWVAMRYLQRQDGPGWHEGQTTLRCFGHEPFWALTVNSADKQLVFEEIDTVPQTTPITQLLKAAPGFPAEQHTRSNVGLVRWASLTSKLCSDGITDRIYGITSHVQLTRIDDDELTPSGTLFGCCTITP